MKRNSKIAQVRFHIGVQVGAEVRTGIDSKKAEMELTAAGVYISVGAPWPATFVPFSNVTEVRFALEENVE